MTYLEKLRYSLLLVDGDFKVSRAALPEVSAMSSASGMGFPVVFNVIMGESRVTCAYSSLCGAAGDAAVCGRAGVDTAEPSCGEPTLAPEVS